MSFKKVSSSIGKVRGPNGEETMVCQFFHLANSQGSLWFGGDPFAYTVPVMLAQLSTIFVITSIVWFLIRPCKQGIISAQLIGGIIMGKSFLGHIDSYREKLFPPGGKQILETSADIGFMFYLFILGVHVDFSLLKRIERYSVAIGAGCFFVPLTTGLATAAVVSRIVDLEPSVKQSLPYVASLSSISSFPVVTSLLTDLNILNSEIGRLATLVALVSDMCSYTLSIVFGTIVIYLVSLQLSALWSLLGGGIFIAVTVFGLRPIIIFVAGRTEGQQMRESHFVIITLVVMVCGLGAEVMGQPAAIGTFLLGVVVPDGPPLGPSYVNKLDSIITGLLVPAKFVISGLSMDVFSIERVSGAACGLIIFVCYVAKFTGVLVPSLYYKIPMRDAITLALIMCSKGAIEASLYITLHQDGMISSEAYAILLISMLMVTGIVRPLISHLYDPSARYVAQCKNSIMLNHPSDELRILVCLHNPENVPTIINLLEATTPLRHTPIAVFVLSLMELKGSGAAVLESATRPSRRLTSTNSWSKQAANAFNSFAQRNLGSVIIRHFTSIAPYASMHDDVCMLAADQVTNIVILPFHKQWSIDGGVGSRSPSIRMVNQNVMSKAPCSVGILIDRGPVGMGHQFILKGHPMYQICLVFLGGPDDCEALAYCTRLIENPDISLKFVWIRELDHHIGPEPEPSMEIEVVKRFRARTIGDERIVYKEEVVKDAIGTTRVINSLKDYKCDLCVVGRYHDPESPLLLGLHEWSECPELGLVGDMLATSDFLFSVLVIQQEPQPQGGVDSLPPVGRTYLSSAHYSEFIDDQRSSYSIPRT